MSIDSVVRHKSVLFAKRIVRMYKYLCAEHKEYVLSKQILRSGTSIGANISEAIYGSSKKDFISKLQIALKEAAETEYWLKVLWDANYLNEQMYQSMHRDCNELMLMLTASIKTSLKM